MKPPTAGSGPRTTAGPGGQDNGRSVLVRTRLRPPVRAAGTVYRHRLDRYGEEFQRRVLTLVKAPAGYGKSSLLGQWFDQFRRDDAAAGWLSLDPSPDDLTGFIQYVVSALQVARPDFGRQLDMFLGSAARPSPAGITSALMNSVGALDEDVFLFIDDFHLASDADVVAAVEAMVERPAPNLHLVISSRHSLPFSLSRHRAKGRMADINGDQLRFDSREAAEFLRTAGHGNLSLAEIDALVSRTEGWAAGIQLAAILLAQNSDRDSFFSLLAGPHRHLSEYLTDDVVDRLPAATIDFLLKTSLLSRLCPDLCNTVTGLTSARAELDELERQSLFLSSLDTEQVWYRYHHLFASVLRRRLSEQQPSLLPTLHRRASDWFARHGLVDEAFGHAIEAGDMDRAAAILNDACDRLLYNGRLSTVLRWADRLPPAALRPFPRVRLQAAFSLILEWRFDDAARIIGEVERDLADGGAAGGTVDGAAGGAPRPGGDLDIRFIVSHRKLMLYHFMDDTPNTERIIGDIINEFPDIDPYLRGNLETCLIYARRETYRLNNVERMDVHARDFYEKAGSLFVSVWHEAVLGPTYYLRGDTQMAERSLDAAMRTAERIDGKISPLVAMPALLLAEIFYERNECNRAAELIGVYGPEAEKQGFVDHLVAYYVTRARLALLRGDEEAVSEAVRAGHLSAARHGFTRLENFIALEEMRRATAGGDLDAVRRIKEGLARADLDRALKPGPHTTTRDEPLAVAWSRACCALGDFAEATRVLRRWIAFAGSRGALKSEVRLLIVLAVVLAHDSREGEALRCLREAVKKAARPRLIRSFIDEGRIVEALLLKLFSGADEVLGPTTAFGLELIRIFAAPDGGDGGLAPTAAPSGANEMTLPKPLNGRETEVIKLVSLGLSNREIGNRLGLTEGSVKWYLQRIFIKLDVRRRSIAVLKARRFGIV